MRPSVPPPPPSPEATTGGSSKASLAVWAVFGLAAVLASALLAAVIGFNSVSDVRKFEDLEAAMQAAPVGFLVGMVAATLFAWSVDQKDPNTKGFINRLAATFAGAISPLVIALILGLRSI